MADWRGLQRLATGIAISDVHWKTQTGEHVGAYETARNSGPRVTAMLNAAGLGVAAPWCAAAVYLWADEACKIKGVPNPLDAVPLKALVQSYVDWAEGGGHIVGRGDRAMGDLACFSFGGERYDHIGLVQSTEPLQCVEGNTYKPDGDDDVPGERGEREGYEVEVRERRIEYAKPTLFIRWAA